MKIKQILTLIALCAAVTAQAATPSWVKNRPTSDDKYIGIGRVALTEPNYSEEAAKIAIDEIAAQICINTSSESVSRMIVVDGKTKELFEKSVNQEVAAELEGQKIKGTHESKSHYYIYYELDKKTYYDSVERKRAAAVKSGFDLYCKAVDAEANGNLASAAQLYTSGMAAVEKYLYLPLTTTYNGHEFDVANELYNGYLNLFNGMVITTNMTEMSVQAFKADQRPIAACLSKNGKVLSNIEIEAKFVSGAGSLTPASKSDANGTVVFYLKNVTSKDPIQSIRIGITDAFVNSVPESYKAIMSTINLPTATITLALTSSNYPAYFEVKENDLTSCEEYVKSILANNYFELNDNVNSTLKITYSTKFRAGGKVSGELYDFKEYYCSLSLDIFSNSTNSMLLKYVLPEQRILVPESQSETQAKLACSRELVKRLKVELPNELKKFNVNLK